MATISKGQKPLKDLVGSIASQYGVDEELIWAQMGAESEYDVGATSPKGASGLMQIMPETFAEWAPRLGIKNPEITNAVHNVTVGTGYMWHLLDRYGGDNVKALRAYNAGSGNEDSGEAAKFGETTQYLDKIHATYPLEGVEFSGGEDKTHRYTPSGGCPSLCW